ncbi:MAG: hypothetical protein KDA67_06845 [Rhodobacteraceae bacterium]|nr:hypothetical protein [Paracoccaceae bacterium]
MEKRFSSADELLALAAFYVSGHGTEILLEDDCDLEAPEDVRGWLLLDQIHQDYGVESDTMLAGLEAHAPRGAVRLLRDRVSAGTVYVELRRDVRQVQGCRPWSIRQGVRLLLDMKNTRSPAPLRLV